MSRLLPDEKGFTIIEVVLFLAISGLMLAGLLAVVGAGINNQRYTEAVDSFQDFLLTQYSAADNVANFSDESGVGCPGEAGPRGSSSCSIIGRLVSSSDGVNVTATPLYAASDVAEVNITDIDSPGDMLQQLQLYTAPEAGSSEEYRMRWDTRIIESNGTGDINPFSLMIVRLPYGGGTISYVVDQTITIDNDPSASEYINSFTSAKEDTVELCVDPAGLQSADPIGIILHHEAAGGAGAIERRGDICD